RISRQARSAGIQGRLDRVVPAPDRTAGAARRLARYLRRELPGVGAGIPAPGFQGRGRGRIAAVSLQGRTLVGGLRAAALCRGQAGGKIPMSKLKLPTWLTPGGE